MEEPLIKDEEAASIELPEEMDIDLEADFETEAESSEEIPEAVEDLGLDLESDLDLELGEELTAETDISEDELSLDLTGLEEESIMEEPLIKDEETASIELPEEMDLDLEAGFETEAESAEDLSFEPIEEEIFSENIYPDEKEEEASITIDLDSLDIDLEETPGIEESMPDEEDITIDLDSLDIELDEDEVAPAVIETEAVDFAENKNAEEDITIDLDSLDIELEEEEPAPVLAARADIQDALPAEDDITLDIDSLDIDLVETDELISGELPDEDEKLTIEDAGLTFEELNSEYEKASSFDEDGFGEDEDIRLTLDEVAPELNVETLGSVREKSDETDFDEEEIHITLDELAPELDINDIEGDLTPVEEAVSADLDFDDIPEIDLGDFAEESTDALSEESRKTRILAAVEPEHDIFDIEDEEASGYAGEGDEIPDLVPGGDLSFSIDYSLKYSRPKAFLRLTGLFFVGLLPHFLVLMIYSLLSLLVGMINHFAVMVTGKPEEDFSELEENTVRYFLSYSASVIGIVDEMPVFAGRSDIDHSLQMNVTYAMQYSRLLAFMRFTIVGIFILTFPHLLILSLISLVVPLIYFAGIISVLITGRWPNFLFDFLTRYFRYNARILAFMTGLVDVYPPFDFK